MHLLVGTGLPHCPAHSEPLAQQGGSPCVPEMTSVCRSWCGSASRSPAVTSQSSQGTAGTCDYPDTTSIKGEREEGGLGSVSLGLEAAQVWISLTQRNSPGCEDEQPARHGGNLPLTLCPECREQHFPVVLARRKDKHVKGLLKDS